MGDLPVPVPAGIVAFWLLITQRRTIAGVLIIGALLVAGVVSYEALWSTQEQAFSHLAERTPNRLATSVYFNRSFTVFEQPAPDGRPHCPPFLIFSIPRPYTGSIAEVQDTSLRNWRVLVPKPRIWIFANEDSAEGCSAHTFNEDTRMITDFELNAFDVPFISEPFKIAADSGMPIIVYSNSDLIYTSRFTQILAELWDRFKGTEFMAFGRRNDVTRTRELRSARTLEDFERALRPLKPRKRGINWLDYVVFTPGVFNGTLPPLTVGRNYFDWWILLYSYRQPGVQVIDLWNSPRVYHLKHSYRHVTDNTKYITNFTDKTPPRSQTMDTAANRRIFLKELAPYLERAPNETDPSYLLRWVRGDTHSPDGFPVPKHVHTWKVRACPGPHWRRQCLLANPATMRHRAYEYLQARAFKALRNANLRQQCAVLGCSPPESWEPLANMTLFTHCAAVLPDAPRPVNYFYHYSATEVAAGEIVLLNTSVTVLLPLEADVMLSHHEHLKNTYFVVPGNETAPPEFSADPTLSLQHQQWPPFALLQIAWFSGCSQVYLLDERSSPAQDFLVSLASGRFNATKPKRYVYDATPGRSWQGVLPYADLGVRLRPPLTLPPSAGVGLFAAGGSAPPVPSSSPAANAPASPPAADKQPTPPATNLTAAETNQTGAAEEGSSRDAASPPSDGSQGSAAAEAAASMAAGRSQRIAGAANSPAAVAAPGPTEAGSSVQPLATEPNAVTETSTPKTDEKQ